MLEMLLVLVLLATVAAVAMPFVSRTIDRGQACLPILLPSSQTSQEPDERGETAQCRATKVSLQRLREVIMGTPEQPGYWQDMYLMDVSRPFPQPSLALTFIPPRQDHPQLRYLVVNPFTETGTKQYDPNTRRGWRGPYIAFPGGSYLVNTATAFINVYGETGDPALLDGWGHPIVIQEPTVGTPEEQLRYTRLVSAGPNGILDTPATELMPADLGKAECADDLVVFLRVSDLPCN